MRLTEAQKALAEKAAAIVPKAVAAFRCRYPTLRKQLASIDATSVAYMAVCRASVTYDPEKSQITTYFSMAIRNALLKELDRNRRARYDAPNRVPMEIAEALVAGKQHALSARIQASIARLPPAYRRLLDLRFFRGLSLREIGEQAGCDPRTIQRRIAAALSALEILLRSEPLVP